VSAAHVDQDELEVLAELEALGLAGVDESDDVSRVVGADAGEWDDGGGGSDWNGDASFGPSPSSTAGLCGAYTATGHCAKGAACRLAHGDLCPRCGRHALHPSNEAERLAHDAECAARAARIAELAASATVECGICMERVLEKARPADRRFGLLSCDHAFCLPCIRSWRGNAAGGFDVDGAVRACPVCRAKADFVTPSATWPATAAAREAIIQSYKTALASIECRHWDRGRGACPFGTSCHYAHLDEAGNRVDRSAGLRFVGDADGAVKPMADVRLSDFLAAGASAGARRVMGRGR
jgi:E3 ubiquitin-protein ligase makorin